MSEQDTTAERAESTNQDTADRADDSHGDQPTGQPEQGEQPEQPEGDSDAESVDYWKAEAEKWKKAARKAERVNKGEAGKLNEELTQLRETVANHDSDAVEAAGSLATERLHTKLARAGISEDDAAALLEHIDPLRLLDDGKPSSKAIESVASSLTRSLGRGSVDEDQGKTTGGQTFSADDWIRRKAGKK